MSHGTDERNLGERKPAEVDKARPVMEADCDNSATRLDQRRSRLEARRRAGNLVNQHGLVLTTANLVDKLGCFLRLDDVRGTEILCGPKTVGVRICHQDIRAQLCQRKRQERSDTASAEDQDVFSRSRMASGHRVVRDGHRLGQCGRIFAELEGRNPDARPSWHRTVLGQAAVPLEADCCVPVTEICLTDAAPGTGGAGDPRPADHEVAL